MSLTVLGSALVPFTNFISLSITGLGVIIQGCITKSNIAKKVESCKFAYASDKKVLIQLKTYLNDVPFDEAFFLSHTKVLDDIITDICPTINGMSKKYDRLFTDN